MQTSACSALKAISRATGVWQSTISAAISARLSRLRLWAWGEIFSASSGLARLLGQPEEAREAWERALEADPDNEDAAYNRDLIAQMMEEQQSQQQNQGDDQQSSDQSGGDSQESDSDASSENQGSEGSSESQSESGEQNASQREDEMSEEDMQALQDLGDRLTGLKIGVLEGFGLSERTLAAILECQRIRKGGARNRQLKYIAKRLGRERLRSSGRASIQRRQVASCPCEISDCAERSIRSAARSKASASAAWRHWPTPVR